MTSTLRMLLRFPLIAAVVSAAACSAWQATSESANPQPRALDFHTESIESTVKLYPSAEVRIDNPWGDIRVRQHDQPGLVIVDAAIQRIGAEPPPNPDLRVSETREEFRLEVDFPGARLEPRTGRVDLVVYVPGGMPLRLRTRGGLIEAKKTANPIAAQSDSGNIHVINTGAISARTESGKIRARPTRPGWEEMDLASVSGAITAFLPGAEPLSLTASGSPSIHSDWPLETDGSSHSLTRSPGAVGADRVHIRTSGMIELYEVIVPPGDS